MNRQRNSEINLENSRAVDVNKRSANGMSPLLAVCSNNRDGIDEKLKVDSARIVHILLKAGAEIEASEKSPSSSHPLVMACLMGKEKVVEVLSSHLRAIHRDRLDLNQIKDPVMGGMTPSQAAGSRFPKVTEILMNFDTREGKK